MIVRKASPADAAGIARVHVDTWRSSYEGIISDFVLNDLSYRDQEAIWRSALTTQQANNYIYVLESKSAELIGFVAAGLERENQDETAGEIYALYLLQEHQGKGLGKQLFLEVAKKLESEGYQSMMLRVLADNPACKFYEAMGGTATRQKDIDIKQNTLIEVAYEWQQLDVIAG